MTGRFRRDRGRALALLVPLFLLPGCGSGAPSPDEAAEAATEAPAPEANPASLPSTPSDLVDAGVEAYYAGDLDAAARHLEEAGARALELVDARSRARSRIWLAQVARRRGELAQGRRHAEAALEMVLGEGLTELEPRAYSTLGFMAWYQNRLEEAARLLQRSLERARALRDQEGISRAANNLAQIHREWGEFGRAREGFEITLQAGRAMEDPYHEAIALVNLGMLDIETGDPLSAIPRLHEARRLFVDNGYPDWESYPLSHLGSAHLRMGDLGTAREKVREALALSRTHGLAAEEAEELRLLAELHRTAGDHPRALELYREAAEIEARLGGVLARGRDLRSIAEIHAAVGDLETAAARAAEALRLHGEAGARYQELLDRVVLAEVSFLRDRRDEAHAHLEAARELARDLDARPGRVRVALAEARIADAAGDPSGVLRALAEVEGDLPRGGFEAEWEAARLRSRAHLRQGDRDGALLWARRAADRVEGVRSTLGSGVLGTAYGAARADTWVELASLLLRAGRPEEAFQAAEAARGGGIRHHLTSAGPGARSVDAAAESLVRSEELLHRIQRLVGALDELEATPPPERGEAFRHARDDLAGRLARARREYEGGVEDLSAGPGSGALLGAGRVEVERVREALGPRELLIEYLVGSERVLVFALGWEGLRVAESGVDARNLESRVRLALSLLRRPGTAADDPALSAVLTGLHEALLGPLAAGGAIAGVRELVVIPHGFLAYLPFGALRDPATGRHLMEDHAVLYAPSSGALRAVRTVPGAGAGGGAGDGGSVLAFAPFPDDLPASGDEVRAVGRLRGGGVHLGRGAGEPEVRRALVSGSTVHLATHGVMNPRNPLFSRLELAPGAGTGNGAPTDPRNDGRLEVHEILGLSVRAPLVFLSGCETGLGGAWGTGYMPGEDYATLDRAFLHAGAENVVATLWRVEDEGAARFAEAFYRELASAPPPLALARAQRAMLAEGGPGAAPFRWAAYRVSGRGR